MTEQWRPIPGWEGFYSASDQGRIRSEARTVPTPRGQRRVNPRILATPLGGHGYRVVTLTGNGQRLVRTVGRLVLTTFHGDPPAGTECCHNNGDPTDDRLENLRWDTHEENGIDTVRHGTAAHLRITHCPAGHEYTEANTYRHGQKAERKCRTCYIDRKRRLRAEQKENVA